MHQIHITYNMNTYLEKIAKFNIGALAKGIKDNKSALSHAGAGAAVFGGIGYAPKEYLDIRTGEFVKKTKGERIASGLLTGAIGAHAGLSLGKMRDTSRKSSQYFKQHWGQGAGSGNASHGPFSARTLRNIHADLEATAKGFKTKAEAKNHFRRMSSMYHPDRQGGSANKMAKINAAWQEFKQHPDGFEKLANSYLEKIAGIMNLKSGMKDLIRNNPLVKVRSPGTLLPKTKPALKSPPVSK